jgi:CRISPR-associated endonuclease/helicase Cas3
MQFQFREIADRYRFISEVTDSIVVPWGKGKRLIERLNDVHRPLMRADYRRLQRYTVSVRDHERRILLAAGALTQLHDCWVLTQSHLYDNRLGLTLNRADGILPIEDTIV